MSVDEIDEIDCSSKNRLLQPNFFGPKVIYEAKVLIKSLLTSTIIMAIFKKIWQRIKAVFGSKDKEKIFTWDLARFEATMQAETDEALQLPYNFTTAGTAPNIWIFAVCDVDF